VVAHGSSAVAFAQVRIPKSDEWSWLSSQSYRHIGAFHLRVGLTLCVTALTFLAAKVKPGRAVAGRTQGGVDRLLCGDTARCVPATACRSSYAGPSAFTRTQRTSRLSAPAEGASALRARNLSSGYSLRTRRCLVCCRHGIGSAPPDHVRSRRHNRSIRQLHTNDMPDRGFGARAL
jgi:hypothetical protein